MARKSKFKESAAVVAESTEKPVEAAKVEAADTAPEQAPKTGEQPGVEPEKHADAHEDLLLLKKIIAQALGEEYTENEEASTMAKEAYESYTEMGMESEKAMEAASNSLKLAHHMGKKKESAAVKEAAAVQEAAKECGVEETAVKPEGDEKKKDEKEGEEKKVEEAAAVNGIVAQVPALTDKSGGEADLLPQMKEAEQKIAALTAEIEGLKAKLIESHIGMVLANAGLSSEKKNFAKLVEGATSVEEVDTKFGAFRASIESVKPKESFGFAFMEKSVGNAPTGTGGGFDSFA